MLVKSFGNMPGTEIGITLHVSGEIVSGLMIPLTDYLDEMAALVRDNGSPESAAARGGLAEVFSLAAAESRPAADADLAELIDTAPEPAFIHLRQATVHAPGSDAVLPATLWRGRLDHVSGWSLGNFGYKLPPANG